VQIPGGSNDMERREAVEKSLAFVAAGARYLILVVPGRLGPDGVRALTDRVVAPLRDRLG
jgi:hypothetical protein